MHAHTHKHKYMHLMGKTVLQLKLPIAFYLKWEEKVGVQFKYNVSSVEMQFCGFIAQNRVVSTHKKTLFEYRNFV